eukprot:SAG25_NODE_54_length_18691_cov_566.202076_17_plen_476_part_00
MCVALQVLEILNDQAGDLVVVNVESTVDWAVLDIAKGQEIVLKPKQALLINVQMHGFAVPSLGTPTRTVSGTPQFEFEGHVEITANRAVATILLRLVVEDSSSYFMVSPQSLRATVQVEQAFTGNLFLFNTAPAGQSISWKVSDCVPAKQTWLVHACSGDVSAGTRTQQLALSVAPQTSAGLFHKRLDIISVFPQENLYVVDVNIVVEPGPFEIERSKAQAPARFVAGTEWKVPIDGRDRFQNKVSANAAQLYMQLSIAPTPGLAAEAPGLGVGEDTGVANNIAQCPYDSYLSQFVCSVANTAQYGHGTTYQMAIYRAARITFEAHAYRIGQGEVSWQLASPQNEMCELNGLDACSCTGGPYTFRNYVQPDAQLASEAFEDRTPGEQCGGYTGPACGATQSMKRAVSLAVLDWVDGNGANFSFRHNVHLVPRGDCSVRPISASVIFCCVVLCRARWCVRVNVCVPIDRLAGWLAG